MNAYDALDPILRKAVSEHPLQVSPIWALRKSREIGIDATIAELNKIRP